MKKVIYLCPHCRKALNFSDNPEYTFQCFDCDEDFYEFEAIVEEQGKLEGVKDFTELVEAAEKIRQISKNALDDSTRYVRIKSKDIVGQVVEYIYETIKPVLGTEMSRHDVFRGNAAIYTRHLRVKFSGWEHEGKRYDACFAFEGNGCLNYKVAFFNADGYVMCSDAVYNIAELVNEWHSLKDSMNRMIPYAIENYNKYYEKEVEKMQEKTDIINTFKL